MNHQQAPVAAYQLLFFACIYYPSLVPLNISLVVAPQKTSLEACYCWIFTMSHSSTVMFCMFCMQPLEMEPDTSNVVLFIIQMLTVRSVSIARRLSCGNRWKPIQDTPPSSFNQLLQFCENLPPGGQANHSFDTMLEHYFNCGKNDKEATLHLAGRLRGSHNLLHNCFSAGFPIFFCFSSDLSCDPT